MRKHIQPKLVISSQRVLMVLAPVSHSVARVNIAQVLQVLRHHAPLELTRNSVQVVIQRVKTSMPCLASLMLPVIAVQLATTAQKHGPPTMTRLNATLALSSPEPLVKTKTVALTALQANSAQQVTL